jgi:hypothetical protein
VAALDLSRLGEDDILTSKAMVAHPIVLLAFDQGSDEAPGHFVALRELQTGSLLLNPYIHIASLESSLGRVQRYLIGMAEANAGLNSMSANLLQDYAATPAIACHVAASIVSKKTSAKKEVSSSLAHKKLGDIQRYWRQTLAEVVKDLQPKKPPPLEQKEEGP